MVNGRTKDDKSFNESLNEYFSNQLRAPEELGELDVARAFHAELLKRDIKRFEVEDWDLTTFEFTKHVNKAM